MKKNQIVTLDKEPGREVAKAHFMDLCGYNRGYEVSQERIDASLEALEDIYDQIEIKALYSEYGDNSVKGTILSLDGVDMECGALALIPSEEIKKVYIYLLKVGDIEFDEDNALNEIFYDFWESAYVFAGREILRKRLQEENPDLFVSGSLGPGFYEMNVFHLQEYFKLLEGEKIGMKLVSRGLMSPMKSFAGFFVLTREAIDFPPKDRQDE